MTLTHAQVAEDELIANGVAPEVVLTYRLSFPESQVFADARRYFFRVTEVVETLREERGRITYSVYLSGPRRRKNGQDSKVMGGELYGLHFTPPLTAIPAAVCDYLHGEDRMRQMEGVTS